MSTDNELRRRMHAVLRGVDPSPAPLDQIIRRGKGIRLRRAGTAVAALALAGIIAARALPASPAGQPAAVPGPVTSPGQVFASGTVNGHAWRLAVQDIAGPGYPCLPAVAVNGTDAYPLSYVVPNDPSGGAAVTLGPAYPGTGFMFTRVPQAPEGKELEKLIVNGKSVLPVTVTACGTQYTLTGFSYPLAGKLRVTAVFASVGSEPVFSGPAASLIANPTGNNPQQVEGLWYNFQHPGSVTAAGTLAAGTVSGHSWSIELTLGTQGDCYQLTAGPDSDAGLRPWCGPVSTPDGPDTIMALTQAPVTLAGVTGYAVSLSPGTARLQAELSDGSTQSVSPRVVAGRKYAAFVVADPLSLVRLIWLNSAGQVLASTTSLPPSGYSQFQP